MLWWIALSALADKPSFEVLDDIPRWQAGMDRLLDGPEGCWDFEAQVTQTLTLHQPPDFFSGARHQVHAFAGPFEGRLDGGRWVRTSHDVEPVDGDDDLDLDLPVYPLLGELQKGTDAGDSIAISVDNGKASVSSSVGQSLNLLRKAVDEWAGRTETSVAQWDADQDAVLLLREIPLNDRDDRPIRVTARFPDGDRHVDRVDAVWPAVVKTGRWPFRVTFRDAQMHLVGFVVEDRVLPRLESISMVIGVMGYTFGYEQGLRFTAATPCRGPVPEEDVAP